LLAESVWIDDSSVYWGGNMMGDTQLV